VISRRRWLRALVAGSALLAASGHTPYRQWAIYRRKHLLILTLKGDGSYPVGKQLAGHLAAILPESAARVTRAPHRARVASLLATRQLELALLEPALARQLAGEAVEPLGEPVPLSWLGEVGDYWLVAHREFHPNHAYRVVAALDGAGDSGFQTAPAGGALPLHEGVLAYQRGEPAPPPPVEVVDHDHDHGHGHSH